MCSVVPYNCHMKHCYSDNTLRELYVGYTQDVHRSACVSFCEMTVILVWLKKIKLDMPDNL